MSSPRGLASIKKAAGRVVATLATRGLISFLLLAGLPLRAQEYDPESPDHPQVVSPKPGKSKIETLEWDRESLSLEPETGTDPKDNRWQVTLRGVYPQKNWNLLQGSKRISIEEKNGLFEVKIPVKGRTASVRISGVSPLGVVETEELRISVPQLEKLTAPPPRPDVIPSAGAFVQNAKSSERRFTTQTALGMTSINYTETTRPDYSAIALTARMGLTYVLAPPQWEIGLSGYSTLTWLSESAPDNIRFIGINARLGYIIQPARARWRLGLVAGGYFTTTQVSDGTFGFQNMTGPQLYPNFRYTLTPKSRISAYFKYSPVSAGLSLMKLGNNELAVGSTYTRDFGNGRNWGLTLDYARIRLEFELVEIVSESITAGVTLGL